MIVAHGDVLETGGHDALRRGYRLAAHRVSGARSQFLGDIGELLVSTQVLSMLNVRGGL